MNSRALLVVMLGAAVLGGLPSCNYERMVDQEYVRPYEARMPQVPAGVVPVGEGEREFQWSPKGSLTNPISSTPESVARGNLCYGYFCIQCHGTGYNGDGIVGQSFAPLPTDLLSPQVQKLSDDALFRSISYGTGKGQPPLFYTVALDDRWHLINWIRSLGVRPEVKQPIPSGDYSRSVQAIP